MGEGSSSVFKHVQKQTNTHICVRRSEGLDHPLIAPVCLVLPSAQRVCEIWDGPAVRKQTLGVSHFPVDSKEDTDSKIFMQPPEESSEVVKSTASHGRCLFPKNDGIYFFKEKGHNLSVNQMKVNRR